MLRMSLVVTYIPNIIDAIKEKCMSSVISSYWPFEPVTPERYRLRSVVGVNFVNWFRVH